MGRETGHAYSQININSAGATDQAGNGLESNGNSSIMCTGSAEIVRMEAEILFTN